MPVYGAVIDRLDTTGNRIVLATEMGMYMSTDKGTTWTDQNFGMARVPTFMVRQQEVYTSRGLEQMLFIATHGRGLYRSSIATGIEKENIKLKTVSSLSVFPNPVFYQAVISVYLTSPAKVNVEVFDLTGKRVLSEEYSASHAGKNEVVINTGNLDAGIYLVAVTTNGSAVAGKIMVGKQGIR